MGADIQKDETSGDLIIHGGKQLHGISMDLKNTPDALPILCVAGCMADGTTVLDNVAGARLKETDRVSVMTEALSLMGADISATENTITIHGGKKLRGCVQDSHGDHRIAMALTVAGMSAEGCTEITGAECASVHLPNFYPKMQFLRRKDRIGLTAPLQNCRCRSFFRAVPTQEKFVWRAEKYGELCDNVVELFSEFQPSPLNLRSAYRMCCFPCDDR